MIIPVASSRMPAAAAAAAGLHKVVAFTLILVVDGVKTRTLKARSEVFGSHCRIP